MIVRVENIPSLSSALFQHDRLDLDLIVNDGKLHPYEKKNGEIWQDDRRTCYRG